MNDQLLEVKALFEEKLKAKTSWGRSEVEKLFNDIVIEVLARSNLKAG